MTNPNSSYAQPVPALPPDHWDDPDEFDPKDWIVRRDIRLNDPVAARRNEIRGWAEAAGFAEVDVRNLGEPNSWEVRCCRGSNTECETTGDVERWFGYVARGCQCRISEDQIVSVIEGNRIATRFRLQPCQNPN